MSSTALSIQLGANGDLLSIRVLGDDGAATIDPSKGTPVSSSSLRPPGAVAQRTPGFVVSVSRH